METRAWTNECAKQTKQTVVNDKDIIVTKSIMKYEYLPNGDEVKKRYPIKTNITKKVAETAKLLKIETINEKAEKLAEILKKEQNEND